MEEPARETAAGVAGQPPVSAGRTVITIPNAWATGFIGHSCSIGSGPADARQRAIAANTYFNGFVEEISRTGKQSLSDKELAAETERRYQCERIVVPQPKRDYTFTRAEPILDRTTFKITCLYMDSEQATSGRAQQAAQLWNASVLRSVDRRGQQSDLQRRLDQDSEDRRQTRDAIRDKFHCNRAAV